VNGGFRSVLQGRLSVRAMIVSGGRPAKGKVGRNDCEAVHPCPLRALGALIGSQNNGHGLPLGQKANSLRHGNGFRGTMLIDAWTSDQIQTTPRLRRSARVALAGAMARIGGGCRSSR